MINYNILLCLQGSRMINRTIMKLNTKRFVMFVIGGYGGVCIDQHFAVPFLSTVPTPIELWGMLRRLVEPWRKDKDNGLIKDINKEFEKVEINMAALKELQRLESYKRDIKKKESDK